jgi:hypothetical protein
LVAKGSPTEKPKEAPEKPQAPRQKEEAPNPEPTQSDAQRLKVEVRRLKLKYKGEEREVDDNEAIKSCPDGIRLHAEIPGSCERERGSARNYPKQVEPKLKRVPKAVAVDGAGVDAGVAPELQNVDWNKLRYGKPC